MMPIDAEFEFFKAMEATLIDRVDRVLADSPALRDSAAQYLRITQYSDGIWVTTHRTRYRMLRLHIKDGIVISHSTISSIHSSANAWAPPVSIDDEAGVDRFITGIATIIGEFVRFRGSWMWI